VRAARLACGPDRGNGIPPHDHPPGPGGTRFSPPPGGSPGALRAWKSCLRPPPMGRASMARVLRQEIRRKTTTNGPNPSCPFLARSFWSELDGKDAYSLRRGEPLEKVFAIRATPKGQRSGPLLGICEQRAIGPPRKVASRPPPFSTGVSALDRLVRNTRKRTLPLHLPGFAPIAKNLLRAPPRPRRLFRPPPNQRSVGEKAPRWGPSWWSSPIYLTSHSGHRADIGRDPAPFQGTQLRPLPSRRREVVSPVL